MAKRFEGRVAVVTGGCSGIGFAVAERLLAEGARLSVWDHDAAALEAVASRLGAAVHTQALDVTDPEAVQRAADATAATLGGLHLLVASAGIAGPNAPSWEYPVSDWRRILDVNVNGVYYCNRAAVPH